MASWLRLASVRARTSLAATAVVLVALTAGSLLLVWFQYEALHESVEDAVELRADEVAEQVEATGAPEQPVIDPNNLEEDDDGLLVRVTTQGGNEIVYATDRFPPQVDDPQDGSYIVATEDAEYEGVRYVVTVASSSEEAAESANVLIPLLVLGVPILGLVVGFTTWWLTGRALRPVERIRAEVSEIGEEELGRRVPVPGSRDEVHRLAVTMNDMLDRLESSQHRQRRFVSDASHELRTPLAVLRQTGEVARAHPDALPADELADTVLEESARMQRLVEQLLVLARSDEGRLLAERRDVDLDDLLLAEAGRARAAGLAVDTTGVGAGRVLGDAGALAQVVRNLVDNAMRHATGRVRLSLAPEAGTAVLTVEDDGPGVPAEERERVFERFVRLDEARASQDGGSGLGLAIVREIARQHGGDAALDGSDLGGARVTVRLPSDTGG